MASSIAADQTPVRHTPPWLLGGMYGGTFNGFVAVSLSQLLPEHGVSLEREAEMAALILTASYISFMITPLIDCGLPRRVWAMLLAVSAAVCLGCSVPMLQHAAANGGHGPGATLLIAMLFFGYLSAQMYSSAIGGMIPNLVAPEKQATAAAWLNTTYLALSGFGGAADVWVVRHVPAYAPWLLPLPILLGAAPLLVVGRESRVPSAFAQAMRGLFRNLMKTARQRSYLVALLVFAVPAATFALQNLLGGMGADFGLTPGRTNFIVGTGMAVACAVGAAVGGPLSRMLDLRFLFVGTGVVAGLCSLAMRVSSHTPAEFVAGVVVYNLMAGINYTACTALIFQIVGPDNPLSATQYSVCIAATNMAIALAVWTDGRGAGHGGVNGALLIDGAMSVVLGVILLLIVWRFGGGFSRPVAVASEG